MRKLSEEERIKRQRGRIRAHNQRWYNGVNPAGHFADAQRQKYLDARLASAVRASEIKKIALGKGLRVGATVTIERLRGGLNELCGLRRAKAVVVSLNEHIFRVRHASGYIEAFTYAECALTNATGSRVTVKGGKKK